MGEGGLTKESSLRFRQDQVLTAQAALLRASVEAAWASASIFATVNGGMGGASPPPIACVRAGPTVASARRVDDEEDVGRSAADIAVPPPRSLVTGELRTWVSASAATAPRSGTARLVDGLQHAARVADAARLRSGRGCGCRQRR
jgi:hypothetical protein